jgi:uncharacterized membrane protein (UPF0127 family)
LSRATPLQLIAALAWLALTSNVRADGSLGNLEIATSSGLHHFEVEIADDEATREHGLMDRRQMAADHGMLFEFPYRAPVNFWMKNTYLSLDMLFIDSDGTVRRVAQRATPLSEALIPSQAPVIGVLELNAGQAAAIHVKPGDKVRFPFFH